MIDSEREIPDDLRGENADQGDLVRVTDGAKLAQLIRENHAELGELHLDPDHEPDDSDNDKIRRNIYARELLDLLEMYGAITFDEFMEELGPDPAVVNERDLIKQVYDSIKEKLK